MQIERVTLTDYVITANCVNFSWIHIKPQNPISGALAEQTPTNNDGGGWDGGLMQFCLRLLDKEKGLDPQLLEWH